MNLFYARENLRNEYEETAESRVRTVSKRINFWDMTSARYTVDGNLGLYSEEQRGKGILLERKQGEREQPQQKKPKHRDHDR